MTIEERRGWNIGEGYKLFLLYRVGVGVGPEVSFPTVRHRITHHRACMEMGSCEGSVVLKPTTLRSTLFSGSPVYFFDHPIIVHGCNAVDIIVMIYYIKRRSPPVGVLSPSGYTWFYNYGTMQPLRQSTTLTNNYILDCLLLAVPPSTAADLDFHRFEDRRTPLPTKNPAVLVINH